MALTTVTVPRLISRRRFWWVLLLLWGGIVALSLTLQIGDIRDQAVAVATEGARNMFRMVEVTRNWNASHGGVYVPVTEAVQPNPYLKHPRRDLETTDQQQLTLINPAYMTRLIAQLAERDSGVLFRLTSLNPIRPHNAPDPWEAAALQQFEQGALEQIAVEEGQRGRLLRYMAPLLVRQTCLNCHGDQGYRVGDIRGGISVSQPYEPIAEAMASGIRRTTLNHVLVFLLVGGSGGWLLTLLRRRWVELIHKMEELAATRDELIRSEKMASLGRMVAGFAHEINTPIGVAVGSISNSSELLNQIEEMLSAEEVSEEELRAALLGLRQGGDLAMNNLRRAAHLIQSFKRTSVDQSSDQIRTFEMAELISDLRYTLHNTLKRLPITLTVEVPPQLKITGIPGLLEQILTNLLLNSIQHGFDEGRQAGEITLKVALEGEMILIQFQDNGRGVAPEALTRIFEPFYTTRRSEGGSGLGLYICYTLVTQRLGGTIECQSRFGEGCRFEIRFPRHLPEPAVLEHHS